MRDAEDDDPLRLRDVASEHLLAVFDVLGFGVALLDPDLRFVDISPRLSELLGRTAAEMRELADPAGIVTPDRRPMVAARRADLAEDDPEPRLDEVVLIRKDGSRIPVEFSTAGVPMPDGRPGLIAICRDLSDRRAREEALAQYTSLAGQMPLGLLFWEAAGVTDPMQLRLVAANAGAARLVGLDLDSVVGLTIAEVFPGVDPTDAARLLALASTDRIEHFHDVRFRVGDNVAVLRWQAAGLPGSAVGVFVEDVTHLRSVELDRRRLLERLIDIGDDERRRLAAAMHDDPAQKLAAATMMLESVRRHPDLPRGEDRLRTVEEMLRSTMATMRRLTFELSPQARRVRAGGRGAKRGGLRVRGSDRGPRGPRGSGGRAVSSRSDRRVSHHHRGAHEHEEARGGIICGRVDERSRRGALDRGHGRRHRLRRDDASGAEPPRAADDAWQRASTLGGAATSRVVPTGPSSGRSCRSTAGPEGTGPATRPASTRRSWRSSTGALCGRSATASPER